MRTLGPSVVDPPLPAGAFRTRGQPSAVAAVRAMLGTRSPHAILLVGPASVGKTTLALDLAAGLLCTADDLAARPCRSCRGCRLLAAGNHPDLHRLAPEGPGRQIVIGGSSDPDKPRGVRDLSGELALLPLEGGARVAVVEEAERMNEDAQHALLKTLEEPPPGVTIVLCAVDEDRVQPTVRSRCARIRLGPVGPRAIEELLAERGVADPPTAARLARLAGGRPGLALAYAQAPEAIGAHQEIARSLLDLLAVGPARGLVAIRELLARAAELAASLASPVPATRAPARDAAPAPVPFAADVDPADEANASTAVPLSPAPAARTSPAERRRAARALLDVWRDVVRDLAIVARGGRAGLHDPVLLEELEAAATDVDPSVVAAFLGRIERTAELTEANANPELALDVLVLAWPHVRVTA